LETLLEDLRPYRWKVDPFDELESVDLRYLLELDWAVKDDVSDWGVGLP
jgi:hypothetical protein